jgi:hypothetical protein
MILRRLPNTEVGNLRGFGRVEDPEMSGFPLVFAKVAKTHEDCQPSKIAKGWQSSWDGRDWSRPKLRPKSLASEA